MAVNNALLQVTFTEELMRSRNKTNMTARCTKQSHTFHRS